MGKSSASGSGRRPCSPKIASPSAVPFGSRVSSTATLAARRRSASRSICVLLPLPSGPSNVIRTPAVGAANGRDRVVINRPPLRERRPYERFAPCPPCRLHLGTPRRGQAFPRGASVHYGSFLPRGRIWTTQPRTSLPALRCASPTAQPACQHRVRHRG